VVGRWHKQCIQHVSKCKNNKIKGERKKNNTKQGWWNGSSDKSTCLASMRDLSSVPPKKEKTITFHIAFSYYAFENHLTVNV
jgi:hypothetical protein